MRFGTAFLGSRALAGKFDPALLDAPRRRRHRPCARRSRGRRRSRRHSRAARAGRDYLLGFVEVHIEQGPVLLEAGPAARHRHLDHRRRALRGREVTAWPATPAPRRWRRGATPRPRPPNWCCTSSSAAPAAPTLVGTVGHARRCPAARSTSCRAAATSASTSAPTTMRMRDARVADVLAEIARICAAAAASTHRGQRSCMRGAAAPCAPALQRRLADVPSSALGLPCVPPAERRRPRRDEVRTAMPDGMLFVRCGNGGISHNPLETITAERRRACARAFFSTCLMNLP